MYGDHAISNTDLGFLKFQTKISFTCDENATCLYGMWIHGTFVALNEYLIHVVDSSIIFFIEKDKLSINYK